jgi:hypothetical protein
MPFNKRIIGGFKRQNAPNVINSRTCDYCRRRNRGERTGQGFFRGAIGGRI